MTTMSISEFGKFNPVEFEPNKNLNDVLKELSDKKITL